VLQNHEGQEVTAVVEHVTEQVTEPCLWWSTAVGGGYHTGLVTTNAPESTKQQLAASCPSHTMDLSSSKAAMNVSLQHSSNGLTVDP